MPNGGNQSFTHHSVGISGNCEYCGRHLRKIGIERTNGKPINNGTGKDWESRKYHKGCWKKIQRDEIPSRKYVIPMIRKDSESCLIERYGER